MINMDSVRRFVPKITAEIPEPKRCCFCVPLRYGLLVWGYTKLVLSLLVFVFASLLINIYTQFVFFGINQLIPFIAVGMLLLLFLLVDIGMTLVFLIGGHQKTIKLMKIFYIYSIVLVIVSTILFIIYNIMVFKNYTPNKNGDRIHNILMSIEISFEVASMFSQIYIIILLRSELNKLRSRKNIRFSNVTKEVECVGTGQNGTNDDEEREGSLDMTESGENSFKYAKF